MRLSVGPEVEARADQKDPHPGGTHPGGDRAHAALRDRLALSSSTTKHNSLYLCFCSGKGSLIEDDIIFVAACTNRVVGNALSRYEAVNSGIMIRRPYI